MIPPDWVVALRPVLQAFGAQEIPYQIGGSLASSAWGLPPSTQDADLVADLRGEHVGPLVAQLQGEYYVDDGMIREAIRHHSSFNLLHLPTMLKVDVFIRKPTAFETLTFEGSSADSVLRISGRIILRQQSDTVQPQYHEPGLHH